MKKGILTILTIFTMIIGFGITTMAAPSSAEEVVEEVNKERAAHNLRDFELDEKLCIAAQIRVNEASHFYSHTRPNGKIWATAVDGITNGAENLNKGTERVSEFNAERCVKGWIKSHSHYEAMMKAEFSKVGIASVSGDDGYVYYCMIMV